MPPLEIRDGAKFYRMVPRHADYTHEKTFQFVAPSKPSPGKSPFPNEFQRHQLIARYLERNPITFAGQFNTMRAMQFLHRNFSRNVGLSIAHELDPDGHDTHKIEWEANEHQIPALLSRKWPAFGPQYLAMKLQRDKDALRVCASLANEEHTFFLSCHDLGKRMHIGHKPALRALERLELQQLIQLLQTGKRVMAKDEPNIASIYRIHPIHCST